MKTIQEKRYPVYTWHADELTIFDCQLVELMDRMMTRHSNTDKTIFFLRDLHQWLDRVFRQLVISPEHVAYLNREDRVLVGKVADWLKDHPGKKQAG